MKAEPKFSRSVLVLIKRQVELITVRGGGAHLLPRNSAVDPANAFVP